MTSSAQPSHPFPSIVPRVTPQIRVDVEMNSESQFYAGLRGDVAEEGGLFIATHRDLRVGEKVLVELSIEGVSIAVGGVVAWRTPGSADLPSGAGVRFEDLSTSDRLAIAAFCARRSPFYFDAEARLSFA